jgi:hypothetical protein
VTNRGDEKGGCACYWAAGHRWRGEAYLQYHAAAGCRAVSAAQHRLMAALKNNQPMKSGGEVALMLLPSA